MKKTTSIFSAIAFAALLLTGCASAPPVAENTAHQAPVAENAARPAPGSKFSKLKLDMSLAQVSDLIGASKECKSPGSPLNPFGGFKMFTGAVMSECAYKKEGVLGYSYKNGGLALSKITVDVTHDAFMK